MNSLPAEKNRRVLVIDDNRAIHEDFRKILCLPKATASATALDATEAALFGGASDTVEQTQFEMDSAYQGEEGVLLAAKAIKAGRPYAMAFVDVRMPPGWDGVETTRKLLKQDPDLQIVICTAYSDYSWKELFEKLEQQDGLLILKKPFDAVEAFQLAHALTEKWWLHEQSRRKLAELEAMVAERTHELQRTSDSLRTEVTEHTRAEEALRESQQILKGILNAISVRIFWKDKNLRYLGCNTAFARDCGFADPKDIIGKDDYQLGWREQSDSCRADDRQIIESGCSKLLIEEPQTTPDGKTITLLTSKLPLRNAQGEISGILGTYLDITERKQAEEALKQRLELQAQLVQIAATVPGMIYSLRLRPDGSTQMPFASGVLSDIFNLQPKDVIEDAAPIFSLVHPDDIGRLQETIAESARALTPWRHEFRICRPRDGEIWIEGHSVPQREPDGSVLWHGFVQDITERKRVETRLFESQKMETVGKLAGGIAHEFNSLLTAIIGHSELLLEDIPHRSPAARSATAIRKAADRAAALTRQLLAYGRKQFLQPEILDLNRVISNLEVMIRPLLGGAVETRHLPGAGLQAVRADPSQIEQVILSMVINAKDAMPNGGRLTLATSNVTLAPESASQFSEAEAQAGNYVLLAITDTGTGMSPEVKARAFEPFFTTKEVGQGTGLALSACYGIIKQSGGHISVQSEPGLGATFKIYLPQVQTSATPPISQPVAPGLPGGMETILLVEQDPTLRGLTQVFLQRLGYTVLSAANGREALSLQQQPGKGKVDLLCTELLMPHLSGQELADQARAFNPHVRILFTVSQGEDALVHQSGSTPGVARLRKPFTPSTLAHKVRQVLDSPDAPQPDPAQTTSSAANLADAVQPS